jgi:alpha-glucosidase
LLTLESDTIIAVEISGWADHFPQQARRSTASKNVALSTRVLHAAVSPLPPHLDLPSESYAASRKKYPVLYMHDGQNVFDETTAFAGEWGVDEALDTLDAQPVNVCVAIDHGGATRLNEYAPFDMEKYGRGEGDAYVDFIVKH